MTEMMTKTIRWKLTPKQRLAFKYLLDKETNEVFFGGGAGGGKSMLGCGWAIWLSLQYEGIRGCMAREELKSLKESTLLTFFDVCKLWDLIPERDYHYNANEGIITFFKTKSTIYLKELKYYPSDPEYDYLGSIEYTYGFIDEAPQVKTKGKNTLRSRIRYRLKENGLIPKLFMSGNPSKGWPYGEFYKPARDNKITPDKKFVQALAKDNRFIDPTYIQNLQGLDKMTKERLLFGNWEYDDDPATLCEYDAIVDMFSNKLPASLDKYLLVDVARFGDDRTVFGYWEGWDCKRVAAYSKLSTTQVSTKIDEWRAKHQVPLSHTLVDEAGVGGGVKDQTGCKGFIAARAPFGGKNYKNLKAQCSYYIAKKINARQIAIHTDNETIKNLIIEEIEQIKAKDRDKDGKLQIVDKDTVKEKIGHSPDFSDMIMQRAWFDLAPKPSISFVNI
jgi:hypothetical protein